MKKNLHKSNRSLEGPLGEQDPGLRQSSILPSQLGKPAKSKSELSLAWTRQMEGVVKILESSDL